MSGSYTSRVLGDYPDTLTMDKTPGAHRKITIDGKSLDGQRDEIENPLVSIITPAFNSADSILRSIQSVQNQTYRNVEHIIIDGRSTDGTVEKIKSCEHLLSYWHTKFDKGIADAFNTGVAVSRGHLIGIVNSDDWMSPNQIEEGVRRLRETGADFSFGDMLLYDGDKPLFLIKGRQDYERRIRFGMPPINHPSVLAKRTIYESIGLFDLRWKIAMDYDWLYRSHRAGFRGTYTPNVRANMDDGGISNTNIAQVFRETWNIVRGGGLGLFTTTALFAYRYTKTSTRRILEWMIGKGRASRLRILSNPRHDAASEKNYKS